VCRLVSRFQSCTTARARASLGEAIGGGLNVERKQVYALVDWISAGEVGVLILAYQDRLARFGFPLDLTSQ